MVLIIMDWQTLISEITNAQLPPEVKTQIMNTMKNDYALSPEAPPRQSYMPQVNGSGALPTQIFPDTRSGGVTVQQIGPTDYTQAQAQTVQEMDAYAAAAQQRIRDLLPSTY